VIGTSPAGPMPDFVNVVGQLDKSQPEDWQRLCKLLAASHFLILPTQAEAFGHVFCEANAFGVPCITTNVGGIPTVVKDGINGQKFPIDTEIAEYVEYISLMMRNYDQYKKLAISSFLEYQNRLNWQTAAKDIYLTLGKLIGNK
jgi:glycosyltransferase involved in cell wall biosynthesis